LDQGLRALRNPAIGLLLVHVLHRTGKSGPVLVLVRGEFRSTFILAIRASDLSTI
jgi:hypothetical protein